MQINKLSVEGFRNYGAAEIAPCEAVNLIVGENAQGKTNLLEAMVYLSTGRSFRTRREQELIGMGCEFADLQAQITTHGREQTLRAVLFAGRRPRQLYVGGVKQRTAAGLSGLLRTVLFCPEDLLVLKNGAAGRRKLIDQALSQLRPGYEKALAEYTRLLESKSRILRERFERPGLLEVLPEYNQRMAQVGAIVISYRARYLQSLARCAGQYHKAFSGGREELQIAYKTVSTVPDPLAPAEAVYEALTAHQASHFAAELESCQCLTGPHRDDFDALIGGMSVKSYGSQGQTRTAAISLKLAEREILRQDTGEMPVLLLDDVLSELDRTRQDFVLNQIRGGQVFITCCEPEKLTRLGQAFYVERGTIRPA